MSDEALGVYLERMRKYKGVGIDTLILQADLSASTYKRFRQGKADIRVAGLFTVLDALRLTLADIQPKLTDNWLTLDRERSQIEALIAVCPQDAQALLALKQLQTQLASTVKRTHNQGAEQLINYATLLYAHRTEHESVARAVAKRLLHQLQSYPVWTDFDYCLIAPALQYLPFAKLRQVWRTYYANASRQSLSVQQRQVFGRAYLVFLDQALQTGNASAVRLVTGGIEASLVRPAIPEIVLLQQFCRLIDVWLAGDVATAEDRYTLFMMALTQVGVSEAMTRALKQCWALVHVVADLAPQPPATVVWTATYPAENISVYMQQLRKNHQVSTQDLCQQLFISRAAYYQQIRGPKHLRTSIFFGALNVCRGSLTALTQVAEQPLGIVATWRSTLHLAAHLARGEVSLMVVKQQVTWLKTTSLATQNVGYRQLAEWLTVVINEQAGEWTAAQKQALALYQDVAEVPGWTSFEYGLIGTVLGYLPADQAVGVVHRYLAAKAKTDDTLVNVTPEFETLLATGQLMSVAAKGRVALRQLLKQLRDLPAADAAPSLRQVQQLATLSLRRTTGQTRHNQFTALSEAFALVYGPELTDWFDYLKLVWGQVEHVLTGSMPVLQGEPPIVLAAVTVIVPSTIGDPPIQRFSFAELAHEPDFNAMQ